MSDNYDFTFDNDLNYSEVMTYVPATNENAFVVRIENDKRFSTRYAKVISWGIRQGGEAVPVFSHPIMPNETFCIVEKTSVYCFGTKMELQNTSTFLRGVKDVLDNWDDYVEQPEEEPEADNADDSETD